MDRMDKVRNGVRKVGRCHGKTSSVQWISEQSDDKEAKPFEDQVAGNASFGHASNATATSTPRPARWLQPSQEEIFKAALNHRLIACSSSAAASQQSMKQSKRSKKPQSQRNITAYYSTLGTE
jgi:hypothetical protein